MLVKKTLSELTDAEALQSNVQEQILKDLESTFGKRSKFIALGKAGAANDAAWFKNKELCSYKFLSMTVDVEKRDIYNLNKTEAKMIDTIAMTYNVTQVMLTTKLDAISGVSWIVICFYDRNGIEKVYIPCTNGMSFHAFPENQKIDIRDACNLSEEVQDELCKRNKN